MAAKDKAAEENKKSEGSAKADEKSGESEKADKAGKADGDLKDLVERAKLEAKKKDDQIADLTDRYKRTLAEYENFRKRTEKEKSDIYTYAVKDVLTKILPVADSFERGLAAVPDDEKDGAVAKGMEKIYKQFQKTLSDIGVKPIEAEGKPFDPNYHNAVMHVEDDSLGENVVAKDLQKGYTYKDTVIRHSMVQVAN
ncbi:MAG: nucleotide exchange factor GrpE [Chordicoccus sp.]